MEKADAIWRVLRKPAPALEIPGQFDIPCDTLEELVQRTAVARSIVAVWKGYNAIVDVDSDKNVLGCRIGLLA
jgi:hypothetical protein